MGELEHVETDVVILVPLAKPRFIGDGALTKHRAREWREKLRSSHPPSGLEGDEAANPFCQGQTHNDNRKKCWIVAIRYQDSTPKSPAANE